MFSFKPYLTYFHPNHNSYREEFNTHINNIIKEETQVFEIKENEYVYLYFQGIFYRCYIGKWSTYLARVEEISLHSCYIENDTLFLDFSLSKILKDYKVKKSTEIKFWNMVTKKKDFIHLDKSSLIIEAMQYTLNKQATPITMLETVVTGKYENIHWKFSNTSSEFINNSETEIYEGDFNKIFFCQYLDELRQKRTKYVFCVSKKKSY